MPIITVELFKGRTREQKRELVQALTETYVRVVTGNHAAYLSSADRGGQCCSSILLEQSDVEAS